MTRKARFLASPTAAPVRATRIQFEEETESTEYDPEEIEVLDFNEIKAELGVKSGRA